MVFGMPRALFPAMALTVFHGGATTVGYLNAAPGLGALIGSLLTGHVGRVRRVGRAVAVCVVGWGLAITAFGLVRWLPAALVLLVLACAADVVSSVFRMIIVQQLTPDALQGRVNSLVFAGLQGGPRLGDAESGAVAELGGGARRLVRRPARAWRRRSSPAGRSRSSGVTRAPPWLPRPCGRGPRPAGRGSLLLEAGAAGQGTGGPGLTRQS